VIEKKYGLQTFKYIFNHKLLVFEGNNSKIISKKIIFKYLIQLFVS